jgi:hypothetical protein
MGGGGVIAEPSWTLMLKTFRGQLDNFQHVKEDFLLQGVS